MKPSGSSIYATQRAFFEEAYRLGEGRLKKGYGWPLKISRDVRRFYSLLKELRGARVLDVGCGEGRNALWLARRGLEVHGLDYSPSGLRLAKEASREEDAPLSLELVMGDALCLPYRESIFDVALDWGCLHHIKKADWGAYLEGLLRVLRRGGYFMLTAFSINDEHLKSKGRNWVVHRGHYDHYFTRKEIRRIFGSNFRILRLEEMLIRKPSPPYRYYNVQMRRKRSLKGSLR